MCLAHSWGGQRPRRQISRTFMVGHLVSGLVVSAVAGGVGVGEEALGTAGTKHLIVLLGTHKSSHTGGGG